MHYNNGMDNNIRGAPTKPPEQRKSHVVQLRLTSSEKEACEQAAGLDGVKMSKWARETLVKTAKRRIKKN